MKKFAIATLALCLSCVMLVGCGCMNTNADVTTLPTNGETSGTTTPVTTAPTTIPHTQPSTESTMEPSMDTTEGGATESTGTVEGALDDIMGGSTDDATTGNDMSRGRTRGNGPRG